MERQLEHAMRNLMTIHFVPYGFAADDVDLLRPWSDGVRTLGEPSDLPRAFNILYNGMWVES